MNFWCHIFIVLFFFSIPLQAKGQEEGASSLPNISKHSETTVMADQGDILQLKVAAEGDGLAYRWATKHGVICRSMTCRVDTRDWEEGQTLVVLLVYNRHGSRHVPFHIYLKAQENPEIEPKIVEPAMVDYEDGEGESDSDDFYSYGREKGGFVYRQNKVERVGMTRRRLDWDEKIAAATGLVAFGRPGDEEHFLMPGSKIKLESTDKGRRLILLNNGTLRSRQLNGSDPFWEVRHGNWLILTGNENSDAIFKVEAEGSRDRVRIYLLRGKYTIRYKCPKLAADDPPFLQWGHELGDKSELTEVKDDDGTEWYQWQMNAGHSLTLYQDQDEAIVAQDIRPAPMRDILQRTTPQYLVRTLKDDPEDDQDSSAHLRPVDKAETIDDAIKLAEKALEDHDALLALEHLIPWRGKKPIRPMVHLLIGRAYLELAVYDHAEIWLKKAYDRKITQEPASYYLGMTYFDQAKWQEAYDSFDRQDGPPSLAQQRFFYKGEAALKLKNEFDARRAYLNSLWVTDNEDRAIQLRQKLAQLTNHRIWWVKGYGNVVYNDNIFHLAHAADRPQAASRNNGVGGLYGAEFGSQLWQRDQSSLKLEYSVARQSWADKGLEDYETVDQELDLRWSIGYESGEDPHLTHELVSGLTLVTYFVGDERAIDGVKLPFSWQAHQIWGKPRTFVKLGLYSDPLPYRDDGIDPLIGELVSISDRSASTVEGGMNITVWGNGVQQAPIDAELNHRQVKHRKSESEQDDRQETGLVIQRRVPLFARWGVTGVLEHVSRNYVQADDHRKDQMNRVGLGLTGYWTSLMGYNSSLDYTVQTSTRASQSFKNIKVGAGVFLDL